MNQTHQQQSGELIGQTPATVKIATCFILLVLYFIVEIYFLANEYYAQDAPYLALVVSGIVGGASTFMHLKRVEPDRLDSYLYGVLVGLGIALAMYALLPRVNAVTDSGGLKSYEYVLGADKIWRTDSGLAPDLEIYLETSAWWQQYQPGDTRLFDLRKGGLGLWQVDMSKIYAEQKAYYDCAGIVSCITK